MASFVYAPLDESDGEIRLMTLLPGPADAQLRCSIDVVRLTDKLIPSFEALSYTWGSPDKSQVVHVLSSPPSSIRITKNLAELLPFLRDRQTPRVLWVDATCINQDDVAERSSQVGRMANIYSMATRVVVWLGVASAESQMAMRTLDDLSSRIEVDWTGDGSMRSTSSESTAFHWGDQHSPLPFDQIQWEAIAQLLDRPWFERLWIWQEVRLANANALMMCGSDTLLWKRFSDAMYCIRYKRQLTGQPRLSTLIDRAYEIVDFYGFLPLKTMLFQARHSKCADKRDRIYGMLGMIHETEKELAVKPDYGKEWPEVYKDLVLRYISSQKRLNIILSCELRNKWSVLPSWVPDFDDPKKARPLINMRASGESACDVQLLIENKLRASGLEISRVECIHDLAVYPTSSHSPFQSTIDAVKRFGTSRDMDGKYIDGSSLIDAYARTLCSGRVSTNFLPPNQTLPDLQVGIDVLRTILATGELRDVSAAARLYLNYVSNTCNGTSFFQAAGGYIGICPTSARKNDILCVLLGCDSPILIRTVNKSEFRIVGECFVPGLMCSEALLGPLPGHIKRVSQYDAASQAYVGTYLNHVTGETNIEDPRLGLLLQGWTRKKHAKDHLKMIYVHESRPDHEEHNEPRLLKSFLIEQGLPLTEFDII